MKLQDHDMTKHDLTDWKRARITVQRADQSHRTIQGRILLANQIGIYMEVERGRPGYTELTEEVFEFRDYPLEFYPWHVIQRIECQEIGKKLKEEEETK